MSAQLDVTRVVRSWLSEDEHDNADHLLDVVLSQLDATPQRRSWWPARRDPQMHLYARLAIAAVAAVAVIFIGLRLLPSSTVGPAIPTTTPTLVPSVAPSAPPLPTSGSIEPGTYLVRSNTQTPFRVTVPSGWTVDSGMIHKGDYYDSSSAAVLLRPWIVTHVYADACAWRDSLQPVGPTKAALVAALTAQTGRNAEGPVDVQLGGLAAAKFAFSVPSDFDATKCDDGYLRPFPGPGGNDDLSPPMFRTSITEIYIVETGGKATAIQAAHYERSSSADVAELQTMLNSILFVP
jgi:hypothetical protein